jgi:hypothetical protein
MEVIRREKQAGIHPDSDVDTYMKVNCDACLMHSQKIGLHIVEVLCQKKIHVSEARGFFLFFFKLTYNENYLISFVCLSMLPQTFLFTHQSALIQSMYF